MSNNKIKPLDVPKKISESLCRNYTVYYINGSGATNTDINSNLGYITRVIFKESYPSERIRLLYNSNRNYRRITEDTLRKTLDILITKTCANDCGSSNRITTVFIGHSFAATILRHAFSNNILFKAIKERHKGNIGDDKVKLMIENIRSKSALIGIGGTKWLRTDLARFSVNYVYEGDVINEFYRMVIPDKTDISKCLVVGRRYKRSPAIKAVVAMFQITTGKMEGHYLKTYLSLQDWQQHLHEALNLSDAHNNDFTCPCNTVQSTKL